MDYISENLLRYIGTDNLFISLAIVIILGFMLGEVVKKIGLPKITGYLFSGIIIGDSGLKIITKEVFQQVELLNMLALGLMSITIGAHFNFHKLKNSGPRVLAVSVGEVVLTLLSVFIAMFYFLQQSLFLSILVGIISISTSPAAIVSIVKETKSRGLLVNTIMPVVAINNILAIVLFSLTCTHQSLMESGVNNSVFKPFLLVGKEIGLAILLGLVSGYILRKLSEKHISSNNKVLTVLFLSVCFTIGMSKILDINALIPNMIVGVYIINTSEYRNKILSIFEEIEHVIMIIFFAFAGAHLDLNNFKEAGIIALVYFLFRIIGKVVGGNLGAYLIKAPSKIYRNVGPSLIPQAGVAIGITIMARNYQVLDGFLDFLTTLVVATVTMNEVVGPIVSRWALGKAEEIDQDRPKLIEFLREEYIKINLKGTNKEEVLNELIEFYVNSHKGSDSYHSEIHNSVMERENSASTAIGHGIAIPHGVVADGPSIQGVIGVCQQGIDFDAPDEEPVSIFILIVTPQHHKKNMHLKVLREVSKMLIKEEVRSSIRKSRNAASVLETLSAQEMDEFNYFLD